MLPMVPATLWSTEAAAATYYVDGSRGDDNATGTEADPVRTIAEGSTRLDPGDTLLIRGGIYTEAMIHGEQGFRFTNGTSMDAMTRYSSYPGETVVLRPSSGYFVVYFGSFREYIEVSDLVLDGSNGTATTAGTQYVVKIETSRHIRLRGNEVTGGRSGVHGGGEAGEILGNEIHDLTNYGIYAGYSHDGSGGLFEGNIIHDCGGFGIHLYSDDGGVENNVIRGNIFYGNGFGYYHSSDPDNLRDAPAIIISRGANNHFYNNILYANYAGVWVTYGAADTLVANNTVYGNETYGIDVNGTGSGSLNAHVVNNLAWENGDAQIMDSATGTVLEANFEFDPMVEDPAGADFRLLPDSPARDAGVVVREVTVDFSGTPRPQDAAFDIGAFEYTLAPPGSDTGGSDTGGSDAGGNETGVTDGSDRSTTDGPVAGTTDGGTTGGDDDANGNDDPNDPAGCSCAASPEGGAGGGMLLTLLATMLGLTRGRPYTRKRPAGSGRLSCLAWRRSGPAKPAGGLKLRRRCAMQATRPRYEANRSPAD